MSCNCPVHHTTIFCVFSVTLCIILGTSAAHASELSHPANEAHGGHDESKDLARAYIRQVFQKYSHNEEYISFEDLERLLVSLGIGPVDGDLADVSESLHQHDSEGHTDHHHGQDYEGHIGHQHGQEVDGHAENSHSAHSGRNVDDTRDNNSNASTVNVTQHKHNGIASGVYETHTLVNETEEVQGELLETHIEQQDTHVEQQETTHDVRDQNGFLLTQHNNNTTFNETDVRVPDYTLDNRTASSASNNISNASGSEGVMNGTGDDRKRREVPRTEQIKCLSNSELLQMFEFPVRSHRITVDDFMLLCPALITQIDSHQCHHCSDNQVHLTHSTTNHEEHNNHEHNHEPIREHSSEHEREGVDEHGHHYKSKDILCHTDDTDVWVTAEAITWDIDRKSGQVWLFASISVVIISLVGLLGVAIVPLMQRIFYNHLLQFLVALAVGSLLGDSLLHLLPHAMMTEESNEDGHGHGVEGEDGEEGHAHSLEGVWFGLVALGGIYFFFIMERLMAILNDCRKNKRVKSGRSMSPKLYRSFSQQDSEVGAKLSGNGEKMMSCEEILMVVHPDKAVRGIAEDAHEELHRDCNVPCTEPCNDEPCKNQCSEPCTETFTEAELETQDLTNNHQNNHASASHHHDTNNHGSHSHNHGSHGHSHGHMHSHGDGSTISSIAWMVIMGDGLHNFSDGLAIGAAFANSLSGGLSTSVAVFCHELPHELGDFAVLLHAGMPVKQALMYNMVSSVLCFLGMVVGVCAGNIASVSLWIFALAAGMFIYIALVDMLPELNNMESREGESPFLHLGLQIAGLLVGGCIMLMIAIYEDKIKLPHFEI